MNHEHTHTMNMQQPEPTSITQLKDFLPLIIIFLIIISLTCAKQWYSGWNLISAMSDFMGFFFLIFGTFKIINLPTFVEAYSSYDLLAKNIPGYAYAYPFIELGLGIAYLTRIYPTVINTITLVIMVIGSISVGLELSKKNNIQCACLGMVFKLPMTYISLLEDLLMAAMAAIMLVI